MVKRGDRQDCGIGDDKTFASQQELIGAMDNKDFQETGYLEACSLFRMDPVRPRVKWLILKGDKPGEKGSLTSSSGCTLVAIQK